jgi:hypothetical protein
MADKWIEKELARQLTPVGAPETLWDRIGGHEHGARMRPARRVSLPWILWPVAAAVVLGALGGIVIARNNEDRFTERELALRAARTGFDYRTRNFNDARVWVKKQAGIDIDLPADHASGSDSAVQLIGVRMVESRGLPIAAIDYEVRGETATLFVSGKRAGLTGNDMGPSQHLRSRRGLTYWNMRNETYTIAFGSENNSRGACLLCHANLPG